MNWIRSFFVLVVAFRRYLHVTFTFFLIQTLSVRTNKNNSTFLCCSVKLFIGCHHKTNNRIEQCHHDNFFQPWLLPICIHFYLMYVICSSLLCYEAKQHCESFSFRVDDTSDLHGEYLLEIFVKFFHSHYVVVMELCLTFHI